MIKIDESKQKYKAEFKDLKFKKETDFEKWLEKTTKYVLDFKDNGQDCLKWYLDKGGEVLHSNLQSFVWNGCLVHLFYIEVGKNIEIMEVEKQANKVLDFVVEKITIKK